MLLKKQIIHINEYADPNLQIFIACNNIEDEEIRVITREEGQKFADEFGLPFYECSAKEGTNINEIFQDMAERVHEVFSGIEKKECDGLTILMKYLSF